MRISIGGVLVTLLVGIDVFTVVSATTALDVEQQTTATTTTPSNNSTTTKDPENIKDPDPDDDDGPPTVGIRNFQPICPSNNSSTGGGRDDDDTQHDDHRGCAVRERLVSAMESDYRLKGTMTFLFVCMCYTAIIIENVSVLSGDFSFRVHKTEKKEKKRWYVRVRTTVLQYDSIPGTRYCTTRKNC